MSYDPNEFPENLDLMNEGEVKAELHERCDRCRTWEDEEIIEGAKFSETSMWVAIGLNLFILFVTVGVIIAIWEGLKALLT